MNRSVLWENVYVGDDAQLTDCTVANRTIVKARASIGEGAVIGERCVIGESAVIRPHLRLWPEKNVSSGAIVSMSLIYGIKWPGSLFGGVGVTGLPIWRSRRSLRSSSGKHLDRISVPAKR